MNSFQEIDYDQKIKKFLCCWEEDDHQDRKAFKSALTGILVPYIYKVIREEKLSENEIKRRKYYFSRLKNIEAVIVHSAWYVLWTLKWLVFITFKNKNKRIILGSFFPKNKTSFEYIRLLLKRIKADNPYLINFSIIYKLEFLLNPGMFCYPHFFSRSKSIFTKNYSSLDKEFKGLFKDYFGIDFRYPLKEYIKSFTGVYNSFFRLIESIQVRNKILYFVQDCDYLNDRVLFSYCCKIKNIPTISFDHSIQIYDHLFYNNYSDYRITWGEYQIDRIKRLSKNMPTGYTSLGRPNYYFKFDKFNYKNNRTWLYILPAFQDAHSQTINRSLSKSEKFVLNINKVIAENYPNIKFVIKPHPSDENEIFPFKINTRSIDELIRNSQLVFIEDSTSSLEILNYEIPVIYFFDGTGNANLHLNEFDVDYLMSSVNDLDFQIKKGLKNEINPKKRERMFYYYFGEKMNFANNLCEFLIQLLDNHNLV